ncbi:MAG: translational GTPase TypA [Alphaproteobacteria bacterium]|nr:MAG: translational GTPase TypA [Alphaproteobacteria bacterium]
MDIRNIAIIAHVDHGKTTLVDALFRQAGTFRDNQRVAERAMDSNDLERERGITILAKCTSVVWQGTRINIVDTPGHADFGGEVERILSMVDGVILLVDAAEGPMPQTKFVTAKALALGLRPIVVINKIDRADARADDVLNEVFDLFVALEASDAQLDFPCLYASGRQGWAADSETSARTSMAPLLDRILAHVPAPAPTRDPALAAAPFTMLVSLLDRDPFVGRVLTGRVESGRVRVNDPIKVIGSGGRLVETGRATKLMAYQGLERVAIESAGPGDIIALAGLAEATVAQTVAHMAVTEPVKALAVDPPTLAMTFRINDGPLAGRDGDKLTSRVLRERLLREAEGNVAIRVAESEDKDSFEVAGRGELQLGVLIETMRREGFELTISRPRVLFKTDPETGQRLEPLERVQIDVDRDYSGVVVDKLSQRRGELVEMKPSGGDKIRLVLRCPSRGLIGYHGEFLTDTRGTGVMNKAFECYGPYRGPIPGRTNGVLISNADGKAVAYALWNLEERGTIMITPGADVYVGMIVGEHSRANDLDVNPLKGKKLTNIRTTAKDEAVSLTPPRLLGLEQALSYIADDELVEVTPRHVRLRKKHLDPHARKRAERAASA